MKEKNSNATGSTVDHDEVEQFSRIADQWWDLNGKFKPLHRIGPVRIQYIVDQITAHLGVPDLKGLSLVDIGCGGGLISEPMARLGASVTGIDASAKNIAVASTHAQKSGLSIDYRATTAEDLLATGARYDVVLALEVIEHVADVPAFVAATSGLVKPDGIMIFSTINRTVKSYALAIIGAEYVMRWLPRGTHDWNKFLKPSEIAHELRAQGAQVINMAGMVMNPLSFEWRLEPSDLSVNYLMAATKNL